MRRTMELIEETLVEEKSYYRVHDATVINAAEEVARQVVSDTGLANFDMDEKKQKKFEVDLDRDLYRAMRKVIEDSFKKMK